MKEYFEKYRSRIILMGLFVFLIHGSKLHSGIIGIDTEDIIHIQGDFYGGWLNTGRQGLYALKWLMNSLCFQPYMAGLFTLVFAVLAVSAFFLLWDNIIGKCTSIWAWMAGGLLLIAHPVITEQFYFTLQSVEICIGLLMSVVALYCIGRYKDTMKLRWLVISTCLLVFTFSLYQAFVVIFIFGTVSIMFLNGIRQLQSKTELTVKKILKDITPYVGVFLVAFLINTIVTKLFFSASDYLGGQILWGKFDIMDNFRAIVGHVVKVLTGYETVHYHFSFGLLCIFTVCLAMIIGVSFWKVKKKKGTIAVLFFYVIALFATPFLMTLVCGGAPAIRSQLVLPLITGFLAYFVISVLEEQKGKAGKVALVGAGVICVLGIWGETSTTMTLYYTDEMRYEQDEALGRELITAIDRVVGEQDLPVAVIGQRPFQGNHACTTGEIIGKSFFDHDVEVEPQYYWSTRRILGFLHILGADYAQADRGRFAEILGFSVNMPVWPAEDSIQVYDGMVVVKLSNVE